MMAEHRSATYVLVREHRSAGQRPKCAGGGVSANHSARSASPTATQNWLEIANSSFWRSGENDTLRQALPISTFRPNLLAKCSGNSGSEEPPPVTIIRSTLATSP